MSRRSHSPPPDSTGRRGSSATPASFLPDASRPVFPLWVLAGFLAAAFLVYSPSLRGDFIWDDDDYVSENETLLSTSGLARIWLEPGAVPQYYPLVHTTFWIEYRLWGLETTGYRIVNLLIHVFNAFLLWRILAALGLRGGLAAGLIFLVHPVTVETAAWITERKNTLSLFFYLLAFRAAIPLFGLGGEGGVSDAKEGKGAKDEAPGARAAFPKRNYVATLGFYICALLSKTVACSLPAALLVAVYWRRGRIARREVLLSAPMFVVGIAMGLMTVWMESEKVGARGPDFDLTFFQRSAIAGQAVWFYVGKLAWPDPLMFVYPRVAPADFGVVQYGAPVLALLLLAVLWGLRGRIGRAPLAAALLFGGTLFPALGFINVYPMMFSYWADHFQYHAAMFPIALACCGGASLLGRWDSSRDGGGRRADGGKESGEGGGARKAGVAAVVVVAVIFAFLSWRHAHAYRGLEALWTDTLAKNPASWLAHTNYGVVLHDRGESERAVAHLREAIRLRDFDPVIRYNLANALQAVGDREEAEKQFREAVRLKPDMAPAHMNLGVLLLDMDRPDEAAEQFEEALLHSPKLYDLHNNYGTLFVKHGFFKEAAEYFGYEIEHHPHNAAAHANLANALVELGLFEQAFVHYREALHLDPANPRFARNFEVAQQRYAHLRTGSPP